MLTYLTRRVARPFVLVPFVTSAINGRNWKKWQPNGCRKTFSVLLNAIFLETAEKNTTVDNFAPIARLPSKK